jgi:hypothetical protein
MTWGFICVDIRPFDAADLGFGTSTSVGNDYFIFNKKPPEFNKVPVASLFNNPGSRLVCATVKPLAQPKAGLLGEHQASPIYNKQVAQTTGSRVVKIIGDRTLLLSEPEEPTLLSSGTTPVIYDKV